MTARPARRPPASPHANSPEAREHTPESYLAATTELVRAEQDEEAVAIVARYGEAMLPLLSPEQVVRLSSLMEGATAAIEATALLVRRRVAPAAATG
jgi:hypothetical protein